MHLQALLFSERLGALHDLSPPLAQTPAPLAKVSTGSELAEALVAD